MSGLLSAVMGGLMQRQASEGRALDELHKMSEKDKLDSLGQAFIKGGDYTREGFARFAQQNNLKPAEIENLSAVLAHFKRTKSYIKRAGAGDTFREGTVYEQTEGDDGTSVKVLQEPEKQTQIPVGKLENFSRTNKESGQEETVAVKWDGKDWLEVATGARFDPGVERRHKETIDAGDRRNAANIAAASSRQDKSIAAADTRQGAAIAATDRRHTESITQRAKFHADIIKQREADAGRKLSDAEKKDIQTKLRDGRAIIKTGLGVSDLQGLDPKDQDKYFAAITRFEELVRKDATADPGKLAEQSVREIQATYGLEKLPKPDAGFSGVIPFVGNKDPDNRDSLVKKLKELAPGVTDPAEVYRVLKDKGWKHADAMRAIGDAGIAAKELSEEQAAAYLKAAGGNVEAAKAAAIKDGFLFE